MDYESLGGVLDCLDGKSKIAREKEIRREKGFQRLEWNFFLEHKLRGLSICHK